MIFQIKTSRLSLKKKSFEPNRSMINQDKQLEQIQKSKISLYFFELIYYSNKFRIQFNISSKNLL